MNNVMTEVQLCQRNVETGDSKFVLVCRNPFFAILREGKRAISVPANEVSSLVPVWLGKIATSTALKFEKLYASQTIADEVLEGAFFDINEGRQHMQSSSALSSAQGPV